MGCPMRGKVHKSVKRGHFGPSDKLYLIGVTQAVAHNDLFHGTTSRIVRTSDNTVWDVSRGEWKCFFAWKAVRVPLCPGLTPVDYVPAWCWVQFEFLERAELRRQLHGFSVGTMIGWAYRLTS
jgi:hypothetical protein